MAEQNVWVVTGANRGLGAEFVRQLLLDNNNYVFAAMRNVPSDVTAPIRNLQARYLNEQDDRLQLIRLDTSDQASIEAAAAEVAKLKPEGVDFLINNAGTQEEWSLALDTSAHDYNRILKVNVVGPFLVTKTFLNLLKKKQRRTVVNLGSVLGSCKLVSQTISNTNKFHSGFLPYNSSKAAINMQTVCMANQLNAEKFTLISLHPGWVDTDMGKEAAKLMGMPAPLTTNDSISGMLKVIGGLQQKDNGSYLDWEGNRMDF